MADEKNYKLSVLLGISDNQIVPQTRSAIKALLELEKVQKRVGSKGTKLPGLRGSGGTAPGSAPSTTRAPRLSGTPALQELRLAREKLKVEQESLRLVGLQFRATEASSRAGITGIKQRLGVMREESRLRTDNARLAMASARTTSTAEMSGIK